MVNVEGEEPAMTEGGSQIFLIQKKIRTSCVRPWQIIGEQGVRVEKGSLPANRNLSASSFPTFFIGNLSWFRIGWIPATNRRG